jgi:hypothetical protein
MASHDRGLRFRLLASLAIDWNSSCARGDGGKGPAFAKGALTSAFNEADNFDMVALGDDKVWSGRQ